MVMEYYQFFIREIYVREELGICLLLCLEKLTEPYSKDWFDILGYTPRVRCEDQYYFHVCTLRS